MNGWKQRKFTPLCSMLFNNKRHNNTLKYLQIDSPIVRRCRSATVTGWTVATFRRWGVASSSEPSSSPSRRRSVTGCRESSATRRIARKLRTPAWATPETATTTTTTTAMTALITAPARMTTASIPTATSENKWWVFFTIVAYYSIFSFDWIYLQLKRMSRLLAFPCPRPFGDVYYYRLNLLGCEKLVVLRIGVG